MPRNNAGEFYYTPGTEAETGKTIRSDQFNTRTNDVAVDLNTPRPIAQGGTGAASAAGALANLGGLGVDAVAADAAKLGGTPAGDYLKREALEDLNGIGARGFFSCAAATSLYDIRHGSNLRVAGFSSTGALAVGVTTVSGFWRSLSGHPAGGAGYYVKVGM